MNRRKFIKVGGTLFGGSAILGSTNTASAESGGLRAYERYCYQKVNKHGELLRQDSAVSTQGGVQRVSSEDVISSRREDSKTFSNALETQDLSPLYNTSKELYVIEGQQFADGTAVTQTVTSEDGSIINVEINGRQFRMRQETVRRVLEKRKAVAKRQLRNKYGSKPWREPTGQTNSEISLEATANERFYDWTTKSINIPITGDTYNDAGPAHCNSASSSSVAGYAAGAAKAWTRHRWRLDDALVALFEGSFNAAAWNCLGSSELKLEFFIESASNGDQIGQTYAKYKSSFLGDLWQDKSDYSENIYVHDPPDHFTVYMKAETVAAAVGTSQTAISAADAGGHHKGFYNLDNYELRET